MYKTIQYCIILNYIIIEIKLIQDTITRGFKNVLRVM